MNHLEFLIQQDNLELFIQQDNLELFIQETKNIDYLQPFSKIESYANDTLINYNNTKQIHYCSCDCFKLAVHYNSKKIFNYILNQPNISVDQYNSEKKGAIESYGWPILSMAIKNKNYEFANKIINHQSFDLLHLAQINSMLGHTFSKENNETDKLHLKFLSNYLELFFSESFLLSSLFKDYAFDISRNFKCKLLYSLSQNEYAYNYIDQEFKNLCSKTVQFKNKELIDLFTEDLDVLDELSTDLFRNGLQYFLLNKLSNKNIEDMLDITTQDNIGLIYLFKLSQDEIKKGLEIFSSHPEKLKLLFLNHISYFAKLDINNLKFLESLNISAFDEELIKEKQPISKTSLQKERNLPLKGIDFLIFTNHDNDNDDCPINIIEESMYYYLDHYPEKIKEHIKEREIDVTRYPKIHRFLQHKKLNEELNKKTIKTKSIKI